MSDFSVVVPVFNSEQFIESVCNELYDTFNILKESFELIFVDDGSSDQTVSTISELRKKHANIRLVRLKKNYGQYSATVCGMHFATCDYVITIDVDGCPPPKSIITLLNQKNISDALLYAEPISEQRSPFRKIGSLIFNAVVRASVDASADLSKHSGSSLRLVKKELAFQTLGRLSHPLLLDITLMKLAKGKINFIPIAYDMSGATSSHSAMKLICQGFKLITAIIFGRISSNTFNHSSLVKESY